MASDEDFARRLQAKYDEEVRATEKQERQDAAFAQELANRSHCLSDSDDEVVEISSRGKEQKIAMFDDKKERKVLEVDSGDDQTEAHKAVSSKSSETSTRLNVSNQNVADHHLSDEDEEREPRIPQAQKEVTVCEVQEGPKHSKAEHILHKKDSTSDTGSESQKKRLKKSASDDTSKKVTSSRLPFPACLAGSQPFSLFLNKSYTIEETHEDPLTLVFPDLLNPQLGEIVECAELNVLVDLEFLMTNYKAGKADHTPLLVMYGEMEGDPKDYSCVTCTKVNLPFQYGTHHTKMMIFEYKTGLLVVVHTANLVPDDWYEKTQGFWVSPLFPELGETTIHFVISKVTPIYKS
ncbi:uncharacterized protein [Panulirus ornatus]|uniref:uncharacterized protein isoform X3 n=1 Tax=Panulirus ornatus TaxID=150431 RepID=UPI003A885642